MGLRELLILVLILAIVGVILRGLYVALRARRGQLRMALVKNVPNYDPDELTLSELPNGGARMVERSFEKVMRKNTELSARDRAVRNKQNEHAIPVLMDSVDDDEPASEPVSKPAPERSSSVANARQAARNNVLGGRRTPPPQKPTHRPIDRIKARDAAAAAAAVASGRTQAADPLKDEYEHDEYEHEIIHDPLHDDGEDASTLIDSRIDDPADDIDGDSLDNTFGDFTIDAIEDVSDEPLNELFQHDDEDSAEDDDYEDDEDEDDDFEDDDFEDDDFDDDDDDFENEPEDDFEEDEVLNPPPYEPEATVDNPDDLIEEIGEEIDDFDDDFIDDLGDDTLPADPDDDEFDDDDLSGPETDLDNDDLDDDDLDDFDDDDLNDDFDDEDDEDDFDDEDDEDDFEDDEDEDDLNEGEDDFEDDDEDDFEDDRRDEFSDEHDDGDYADDRLDDDSDDDEEDEPHSHDDFASDDGYVDPLGADLSEYDDYGIAAREQGESRSWWQKVGSKFGFGGSGHDDQVDDDRATARERAEPVIGDSSFDSLLTPIVPAAAAASAAAPDKRVSRRRHRSDKDLDPRRQQERGQLQAHEQATEPTPDRRQQETPLDAGRQKELELDAPASWPSQERYAEPRQQQPRQQHADLGEAAYDEPAYDDRDYQEPGYENDRYEDRGYDEPRYQPQYQEAEYQEQEYEEPEAEFEPEPEPQPEPAPAKDPSGMPDYNEVLVINVMAKPDRELAGVDVLQALLGTGLRFGEMNIFHRHLDGRPNTPVVFSVANMVNPGTFDLNKISEFSTRGVCFFMTLPNVVTSMQAFDLMLDVAQRVRIALDGDLKDDNRSVMTAQTIEHYRQRVRDFDLRQLRQKK